MDDEVLLAKIRVHLFQQYDLRNTVILELNGYSRPIFAIKVNEVESFYLKFYQEYDIEPFLDFQYDLCNSIKFPFLKISAPVKDVSGDLVNHIELTQNKTIKSVLFRKVPGCHLDNISKTQALTLGKSLGQIHSVCAQAEDVSIPFLDLNSKIEIPFENIHFVYPNRRVEAKEIEKFLVELFSEPTIRFAETEYGICHGDLGLHNLLFSESIVSVIDFDNLCQGILIYDLACILWSLIYAIKENKEVPWNSVIKGYSTVIPLAQKQIEIITKLAQYRAIWHIGYTGHRIHKREQIPNWMNAQFFEKQWEIFSKLKRY